MRRLLFTVAALLSGCNAGLAQVSTMGTTAMGLPSTPATIVTSPLYGPSPFSATTLPGAPDTTLAPVPLASDPTDSGNGRDLCYTDSANYARNSGSISCAPVVTAAGHITRAVVAHYCGTTFIDVVDRDDASDPIGDHSHANRGHHDREHLANVPAWHSLDHRMQLDAGRPADQWRGFAALDAGNSGEPATRYDSARRHSAWRHQHRSDSGGDANAEHVGMRREHDDESGDARHDGAGQRHGRRGNAGRMPPGC